jgi:hypothetical protein
MKLFRALACILALVTIGALSACGGSAAPSPPASTTTPGSPDYIGFSEREAVNDGLASSVGDDATRLAESTTLAKDICGMLAGGMLQLDVEKSLISAGVQDAATDVQLAKDFVCPSSGS